MASLPSVGQTAAPLETGADLSKGSSRKGVALVLGLAAALFLIRFTEPRQWSDGYHQERAIAYVMDVLFNGNWICQTGAYDDLTSKPPLLTWLIALSSLALGGPTDFSIVLPSALATTTLALLIFWAGRKYFGPRAGLFAALMYLLSPLSAKQIALIRIDVLFSMTVAATALCAFECWQKRLGWTWFWLAAALATLTKGPLGLLLGASGLLAALWERKSGKPAAVAGFHLWGALLFLALCGGWFLAAYLTVGQPLIDVMLGRELLGHVVEDQGGRPFSKFYSPILYVCRCFIPWIIFSLVGFWRVLKHPSNDDLQRRFERFLFAWFAGGLFIFSAAAHQRPDLIFPLMPPVALLAGRELQRLLEGRAASARQLIQVSAVLLVLGLSGVFFYYHISNRKKEATARNRVTREWADEILRLGGGQFPLTYTGGPVSLQFYLRTKRSFVSVEEAAELLRGSPAAFVVTDDLLGLRRELDTNIAAITEIKSWKGRKEQISLVANRPALQWEDRMACVVEPVKLQLQNIREMKVRGRTFEFGSGPGLGTVAVAPSGTNDAVQVEGLGGLGVESLRVKRAVQVNGKTVMRVRR